MLKRVVFYCYPSISSQAGEAPFARSDLEVSDDRMRRTLTLLLLELLPLRMVRP